MSYAVPQPPPAKARPGVVSAAVNLLWAMVAVQVVSAVLVFLPNPELDRDLDAFVAENPDLESARTLITATTYVGGAITLLVGVALVVLAIFVGRGSQPARIVTWVVGGLLVLCNACGALLSGVGSGLSGVEGEGTPESEELARIIEENTPSWTGPVGVALTLVSLVAFIAVIILLALPASNDFFRKEQEVWVPPTVGGPGGFPQLPPPATTQNPMAPPPPPAAPPADPSKPV